MRPADFKGPTFETYAKTMMVGQLEPKHSPTDGLTSWPIVA